MPAITLGLAEVEERLHQLRRRLNWLSAQHAVYLSLSVVALVATALIILALRGAPAAFRAATWGGALLCLASVGWCVFTVRHRWLDVPGVAHLADRRAALIDRLTTLVDLRRRPRPSRLAPVLVAQVLALSPEWQPARIAPRRIPRSVYALVAALLALGCTAFIERRTPEPPIGTPHGGAVAPHAAAPGSAAPLTGAATGTGPAAQALAGGLNLGQLPQGGAPQGQPPSGAVPQAELRDGRFSGMTNASVGAKGRGDQSGTEQNDSAFATLPDKLQDAIRRAFHAEQLDRAQQLTARAERTGGEKGEPGESDQRGETRKPPDDPRKTRDGSGSPKGTNPNQQAGAHQPKPGDRRAEGQSGTSPNQQFDGPAPAAGEGSNPAALLGAKPGKSGSASPDAPKTFKLTITSFLHAMEQKGKSPRPGRKKGGSAAGVGGGAGTQLSLSERQLTDDALRKAEIPPEYEDLVRRVYSSREER
jgi:hypothetical protein